MFQKMTYFRDFVGLSRPKDITFFNIMLPDHNVTTNPDESGSNRSYWRLLLSFIIRSSVVLELWSNMFQIVIQNLGKIWVFGLKIVLKFKIFNFFHRIWSKNVSKPKELSLNRFVNQNISTFRKSSRFDAKVPDNSDTKLRSAQGGGWSCSFRIHPFL